jgi:hypothetical protein
MDSTVTVIINVSKNIRYAYLYYKFTERYEPTQSFKHLRL